MADLIFNDILEVLIEIHEEFPDLKFGQVIQIAIDRKKGKENVNFSDISSKEILSHLNDYKNHLKTKTNKQ